MTHSTAHRHAASVAARMDKDLPGVVAEDADAGMLVLLLLALGYTHRQVDDVLQQHGGFRNSMRLLDTGLYQYRSNPDRKLLYRQTIDQLTNENERTPRKTGRAADRGSQSAEEADNRPVGLAGRPRETPGVRAAAARAARHGAAHADPAQTHHQHRLGKAPMGPA